MSEERHIARWALTRPTDDSQAFVSPDDLPTPVDAGSPVRMLPVRVVAGQIVDWALDWTIEVPKDGELFEPTPSSGLLRFGAGDQLGVQCVADNQDGGVKVAFQANLKLFHHVSGVLVYAGSTEILELPDGATTFADLSFAVSSDDAGASDHIALDADPTRINVVTTSTLTVQLDPILRYIPAS